LSTYLKRNVAEFHEKGRLGILCRLIDKKVLEGFESLNSWRT
jgi:hypothetical protein